MQLLFVAVVLVHANAASDFHFCLELVDKRAIITKVILHFPLKVDLEPRASSLALRMRRCCTL